MSSRSKFPVILITPCVQQKGTEFADCSTNISDQYPGALLTVGGIPWILPCIPNRDIVREAVSRCDGVLITGGEDINPVLYLKEVPEDLRKTVIPAEPQRDLMELLLIEETLAQKRPLMAICRGHQLMNVALGGTLFVDIPSQCPGTLNHSRLDMKNQIVHEAQLVEESLMRRIFGKETIGVNSSHHQAIDKLAKPFRVSGRSPDGIIESIELTPEDAGLLPYFLSVQFHPERLYSRFSEYVGFFKDFVDACRRG